MADASIPNFKTYAEGEPLPPVDPEDLKRTWECYREQAKGSSAMDFAVLGAVCGPGANVLAAWNRYSMLWMLVLCGQLLAPWQHGEELDEVVFRVAATFPMERMKRGVIYSEWPFDVDGFLQRLRDESGGS